MNERRYFGTDGIRGRANSGNMTPEFMLRLGIATGSLFMRKGNSAERHRVVIGKDTRLSGYMFEAALMSGFVSVGMDVMLMGPIPTPAVGMLTRSLRADLGVMISASHNPAFDNGIKLFDPDGFKLLDSVETQIEQRLASDLSEFLSLPNQLGRIKRYEDANARYIEMTKATFPKHLTLQGLKIVVDTANGAAYKAAPAILYELGAEVIPICMAPDGHNINKDCGSLYTKSLANAVQENRADIGIALDGDADRVILCDEKGQILNGDIILGLIARHWHKTGLLRGGGIVATIMSNMALESYLLKHGIHLARTRVGDRYVVEKMRNDDYNLGGEQSGHLVFLDYVTTGDGMLAALQLLVLLIQQQKPLSELARTFELYPQIIENISFDPTKGNPLEKAAIKQAIEQIQHQLTGKGRVLVRMSGTEPLLRVMIEAEDQNYAQRLSTSLVTEIKTNLPIN